MLEQAIEERNKDIAKRKREDSTGQESAQTGSAGQVQGEQWRPEDENWVGLLAGMSMPHLVAIINLVSSTFLTLDKSTAVL